MILQEEGDPLSYLALYRKWRPSVFEDVIIRNILLSDIKNQIKNQNIAHAYLFCGTRGNWEKNSTAKIFAKRSIAFPQGYESLRGL